MLAEVWSELEVDLPADEIWAVYSSPDLPRLIMTLLPTRYETITVLEGNGTQGTVLDIVLQPANRGPLTWHEKFTKIDHKHRVKVVTQIVGGYLADTYGFNSYANIFTVTPKGRHSCVIRTTASFDVKEGSEANTSFITAGNRGPRTWHEKFTKIDNKQRVKVVAQLVGGYLDDAYGFNSYAETFTITPKGCNSCVIRQASSFDVKEGSEANASFITADWSMARAVEKYVKACRATATAKA
ncbi:hypothetical protein IFM89_032359 [Coptis chinensis]|uniref:Uncharacterized protein n=1 Tax=Coptis chinensis TaxID=261450 RepID=A0A835HZT6_9MAGN|nr:hypothetical protein IFM89_032359 [Coptis chinensis]